MTFLAAHRGVVVWSGYDRARDAFVLRMRSAGVTSDLPVAPRSVPFDADIGTGADGGLAVLYSRCAGEPATDAAAFRPRWTARRGCRLYEYDVRAGAEQALADTHLLGASESLPSRAGRRLAFVRTRRSRGRLVRRLHVRAGASERAVVVRGEVASIDASARAIAYAIERSVAAEGCPTATDADHELGTVEARSVWLLRTRARRLAVSCGGAPESFSSPSFAGGGLFLLAGGRATFVERRTAAGRRAGRMGLPAGVYDAAVDGDAVYGVRHGPGGYEVLALTPSRFG